MDTSKYSAHWKRNAMLFIAGQFLSMFGSMMVQHAVMWHITLGEQSGGLMAIFTSAALLPMVFISPFAGVWADRYNRKYLVNIADGAIAMVTLIVAALYMSGYGSIEVLLSAVVVRSIGQGMQQPAANALIPQMVPEEHLARFNGLQSTAQSITMFAAPMAGGALLSFLPIEYVFFIDVITAAIGIAIVFFCVHVPVVKAVGESAKAAKSYVREMLDALKYISRSAWLKTLFISFFLFGIFAAPTSLLTPLQVTRSFGADVWRLTTTEIVFSIGMMLGGVVITAWGGFKNKVHTLIFALLIFGVATLLFGVTPNFWMYQGVMILCGSAMPIFNTPCMTMLQSKVPADMLGRVFSAITVFNGLAMPLGMALFGPLADIVKIEWILVVMGFILLAGGFVLFGRKELVGAGIEVPVATE